MRVLVVEDDLVTAARIEIVLQAEDFICDLAHRGETGIQYGKLHSYDIILLDLMLPDMDGYDVLQQLREAQVNAPVLILSGLSELDDKIKGLSFGADDFLTKPFEHRELVARIRAIVRRSKGLSQSTKPCGALAICCATRSSGPPNRRAPDPGCPARREFRPKVLWRGDDRRPRRINSAQGSTRSRSRIGGGA